MLTKLSYAASAGRLSPGDLADVRNRLSAELTDEAQAPTRALFGFYCDELADARGDQDRTDRLAAELRAAVATWSRPDPIDMRRRDIHG